MATTGEVDGSPDSEDADSADARAPVGAHRQPRSRRPVRAVLRHLPFALVLAGGIGLRVAAQLTYLPAVLYWDSYRYLANAETLRTASAAPIGYSLLAVRPLLAYGDLTWLPAANHVFGVLAGLLLYLLVLHRTRRAWLGTLAAAPVLLDAYVVQIEQMVMSDALFLLLVAAAFTVLLWRRDVGPGPLAAASVGMLVGALTAVRLVGAVLVVPAVLAVLLTGRGRWLRLTSTALLLALFAAPLVAIAVRYESETGVYALSGLGPRVLYGRVAPVADCEQVAPDVRFLCPDEPLGERRSIDAYVWSPDTPAVAYIDELGAAEPANPELSAFVADVVRDRPGELAWNILRDYLKGFAWTRTTSPGDVPVERWHFDDTRYLSFGAGDGDPDLVERAIATHGGGAPRMNPTLASALRDYQLSVGWTPGTLVGLALLLGIGTALLARRGDRRLRVAAGTLALAGAAVLGAAAVYEFSWRYQLPGLVLAPPAGAMGIAVLLGGRRRPPVDDAAVDAAAIADLRGHHGEVALADLCVVIAAYDEEEAIGDVLDAIPDTVCGLAVDRLVVVDGARDATAAVAREHGALVADCPTNRGQGAALRLGYRIARDGGARYVATLDADGQYDPAELEVVVAPLVADEADFVTGSRRLGQEATTDGFRRAGVRVFARLVTLLTGQPITDTSNGLRAMRAEVTGAVELRQPQYQASELLIGVLARGFRVVERPTTMRDRTAGTSKKGHNLLYGLRYGRVVVGTWWRERRRGVSPAAASPR